MRHTHVHKRFPLTIILSFHFFHKKNHGQLLSICRSGPQTYAQYLIVFFKETKNKQFSQKLFFPFKNTSFLPNITDQTNDQPTDQPTDQLTNLSTDRLIIRKTETKNHIYIQFVKQL